MRKLILFFTFLTSAIFLPNFVLGQTDVETEKRLLQVESSATKSAKIAATSASRIHNFSFISGTITSSSSNVLTIQTINGQKIITTVESTRYLNFDAKGKKLIGFGDLKIGDSISILGVKQQSGTGVGKLIVRDTNPKVQPFSTFGRLGELKADSLTLKYINRDDLPTMKILYSSSTIFKKGSQVIQPSNVDANSKLIVVGSIDDKGNLNAGEVQVVN